MKDWRLDPEKVKLVEEIKNLEWLRPLYKLLIIAAKVTNKTVDLKFIFGGYYYQLIKESQYKGFLYQEYGKVMLTDKGRQIAETLYNCYTSLKNIENKN